MKLTIMKGGEPFFYKKGKTGALLLHGYTSTPQEVKALGKYLAKKNITVFAPLLPGHGTQPEDLEDVNWKEWVEESKNGLEKVKKHCDNVFVIGSSLGGNLALYLGTRRDIKAIISLGTPLVSARMFFNKLLLLFARPFKRFVKKRYRKKLLPIVEKKVQYMMIPTKSVPQMLRIVDEVKAMLPKIKKPILIMQALDDMQLGTRNAHYIYNKVSSKQKKLVFIPDSYHVFVMDKNKSMAFKEIYSFINQVLNNDNNNS